ncbi:hypothetical protein C2845_PM18G01640 [Panicum miliaceum]|uniref:Uncharacterized protein n=1 Tax=Panicum miliaceum TaxID=4540 RepID=A0A3L6PKH6_PANMI|nr:hypothetical protein C2845_PM18G01640 [Panicum miliaceum]
MSFLQVVGNENDEAQIELLKDTGMQIIAKCDCLPLAIKVMGGLLRQKMTSQRDWENVLNDSTWSISQMPEELNNAIYLSYEDLSPSLKPCFLHYSLLPKSRVFFTDDIVGMWISEGFVHGTSRNLEEIGKDYFVKLIHRNLIEPDINYADQVVCNMHDVVRSFAQYLARNEALVAQNKQTDISDKMDSQKFFRLSLEIRASESDELEWYSLQAQTSLRTLLSVGPIKIKPGDSFLAFSNLRTLHVEDANFDALVESLNQLKHLRYLSIEGTNTSRLPENISKMKFLQYISLLGCNSLVNLPNSIVMLQHLRFLNIRDTGISSIPQGFHGLTNLRILYGFPVHMDGDWCSHEELGPLSQLTRLNISSLENVSSSSFARKARIDEKVRLSYLWLECTSRIGHDDGQLVNDEEGIPEKQQREIEEVFNELPRWMVSTTVVALGCLRILTMDDLACCTELPNGLCQLPCLELLQIIHAPAIKRVGPEFLQPNHHWHNHSQVGASFPRLSRLDFIGLVELEEWEWQEQVKAMPILEQLKLEKCNLRRVPPSLAFHARALEKLFIYDVKNISSLENFASVVHLDVFRNTDLERISNLTKLQKLVIVECPKMKVLEGLAALQRLNLEDYDMQTVPRYLQDVKPRLMLLDCSLPLLTSIAAGKHGPEWDKFSHIHQVKAYADDEGIPRKKYMLYTSDPFRFETNISFSAIARARNKRKCLAYMTTCTIEDEWPQKPKLTFMAVVLDVLASYVQNMLTEMVKEEVHMLLGVSGEIDEMCTKLGDLKNSLADADRRNTTDQSVQAWVRELKGAMYEASDILDLCHLKSMERQPVRIMTQGRETSHGDKKILIFAIVGVGGIGKTTLAQNIFNNNIIQQEFTKYGWALTKDLIRLSCYREPSLKLEGITKQLEIQIQRECVLKTPLVNVLARGSRVLVTTRDIRVARGMMAEEPYHHVKKLEPEFFPNLNSSTLGITMSYSIATISFLFFARNRKAGNIHNSLRANRN